MRVAILPSGALLADTASGDDDAGDGLSVAARARVARAFGRGPGHAMLDLGATELDAALAPALAFLRDLGRTYVTRLCAVPDLEERRERVDVDCPPDERARLAGAVPPMDGGEYVDADWVAARWADLHRAFADEIRAHRGPVAEWLRARHPSWHAVGKVCLHLAENRGDEEHPFAFLATYAVRAGAGGKVQHRPPTRTASCTPCRHSRRPGWWYACPTGGARGGRRGPRSPCASVTRSRARSAWTRCSTSRSPSRWATRSSPPPRCASSWHPPAGWSGCAGNGSSWTASGCARCSPTGSACGVRPRRAGSRSSRACDCSPAPRRQKTTSLRWRRARAGHASGAWLARTLEGLRGPAGLAAADPGADFRGTLRPYQKVGVSWLAFASSLRLGVCLADDMGLGKTIQVLGLLLLHKRRA